MEFLNYLHDKLVNLGWTASGHTGTASRVAGFSGAGAAAELAIGTDLLAPSGDGSGLTGIPTIAAAHYSCGRPTTESGVPVSITDRSAQGTIYWTPYQGNVLTVLGAADAKIHLAFSETSYTVAGDAGKNYDIYGYSNSGTLALERSAAWSDDFTPPTRALVNGCWVLASDHTRRVLASFRCSATDKTCDIGGGLGVAAQRYVAPMFNRILRPMRANPGYSNNNAANTIAAVNPTSWARINGGTADFVDYLFAISGQVVSATLAARVTVNANDLNLGIGNDSTSIADFAGATATYVTASLSGLNYLTLPKGYSLALGRHYLQMLWYTTGNATATYYADAGRLGGSAADNELSGLTAWLEN